MEIINKLINVVKKAFSKLPYFKIDAEEQIKSVEQADNDKINFKSLTPNGEADPTGVYCKAINYALNSNDIFNIALSGPYGAGKSSVIKTFKKNNDRYKFINVSLATFNNSRNSDSSGVEKFSTTTCVKEENEKHIEQSSKRNDEIEKSILQQILYSVKKSEVPQSRFRRIEEPNSYKLLAFLLSIFFFSVYFIYEFKHVVFSFDLVFYPQILSKVAVFYVLWFVFFIANKGLSTYQINSFKRFSIINGEFEFGDVKDESFLNKYIDEIVYFFEVTENNVVIFEDLDRFENSAIFTKLREINYLINVGRKKSAVKFIYAIRDDIFEYKDRTKFFDFIIPIIPYVNRHNSHELVLKLLREERIDSKVKSVFIDDVSYFIDDARLVFNILNEFNIYSKSINADSIDLTRLLAVIIYKNYYSSDFEAIHRGEGLFLSILDKKEQCEKELRATINKKIETIKTDINKIENESIRTIRELILVYKSLIFEVSQRDYCFLDVNGSRLSVQDSFDEQVLNSLNGDEKLFFYAQNYHQRHNSQVTFNQLQAKVSSYSFKDRAELIKEKNSNRIAELQSDIHNLNREIIALSENSLEDYIKNGTLELNSVAEISNQKYELLKFLVSRGYLDENYDMYISIFHGVKMSIRDHQLVISVKSSRPILLDEPVDNPAEVIKRLTLEQLKHSAIFNIYIVDFINEYRETYTDAVRVFLIRLSENPIKARELIDLYILKFGSVINFLSFLARSWGGYPENLIKYGGIKEVSYILAFLPKEVLVDNFSSNSFYNFIERKGDVLFGEDICKFMNFDNLKYMDFKFDELSLDNAELSAVDYLLKNCLFRININNYKTAIYLVEMLDESVATKNFLNRPLSTLLDFPITSVRDYFWKNITVYLEKVFLVLDSEDSQNDLITILSNENISLDHKISITNHQMQRFDSFVSIQKFSPELIDHIIGSGLLVLSLKNISDIVQHGESLEKRISDLIDYSIDQAKSEISLLESNYPAELKGKIASVILLESIVGLEKLKWLFPLLTGYKANVYPEHRDIDYCLAITERNFVCLNSDTFEFSSDNKQLRYALIKSNYDFLLSNLKSFSVDAAEYLFCLELATKKTHLDKLFVVAGSYLHSDKKIPTKILKMIINFGCFEKSIMNVIRYCIIHSTAVDDKVFAIVQTMNCWELSDYDEFFKYFPRPYNEIGIKYKRPKIPYSSNNIALGERLEQINYISSCKKIDDEIQIINKNK